ncbi:MAG TPA: PAS domain S-box protein, partial [Bryobacteraceae bacterium]|nr:PAS domain S-box protein [Bryobacteraceae bacterium]
MTHTFLRRSELISIAIALVMLVAIAVFSTLDWVGYRQDRAEVLAGRQVLEDINRLMLSIAEAEASQRNFLLTGNEPDLRLYSATAQTIPRELEQLDRETAGNAPLHARIAELKTLIGARLDALRAGLQSRKSDDGKSLMDSIRTMEGNIRKELRDRIEARSLLVRTNSDRSHLITVLGSIVLFVLLALAVLNIGTAAERREQLIADLHSERRHTSEVLDLLKTTLFSIGDAVLVTDRQGRITDLNRIAEALTGWSEKDASGKPSDAVLRIVDEANRQAAESPVERILRGRKAGEPANHPMLIAKHGTVTPIEHNGAPIAGPGGEILGVVLVFRDITNRRAAERENERLLIEAQWARQDAEQQRSHLHSLFRQAPASINIYRGPDHIFELLHPLAQEFFGSRDVTGLSARDVHLPGLVAILDEVYRSGETRILHEFPLRMAESRGGEAELYVNYLACVWKDNEGTSAGVMTLAIDVTEQVGIKRAMRTTEERLRETAKLESLGVLAGGIAHDFNNLLVGIMGNASLALEALGPRHSVREMLESVINASERAAVLTRQMLAYSGKGRFVIQPVAISDLVSEMLPLLRDALPKTILLRTALADGLPEIEADSAQIQQVFMNLLINAGEACGHASGCVTIRTALEQVDAPHVRNTFGLPPLLPGMFVSLEVGDTGAGMDEATKARIFDPFFTTKFTGRGLGLSAVLGIVRSHKGAIHVRSEPGRGSTFKALFPAAGEHLTRAPRPAVRSIASPGSGT